VWQSPDPILGEYMSGETNGGAFNPRNLSLFAYTYNNPVNLVDPDGNFVQIAVGLIEYAATTEGTMLLGGGIVALGITAVSQKERNAANSRNCVYGGYSNSSSFGSFASSNKGADTSETVEDAFLSNQAIAGGTPNGDDNDKKEDTDPKRGSNDPIVKTDKEAAEILKKEGYKPTKQKVPGQDTKIFRNPKPKKGMPEYMTRSRTSHNGDAFKGAKSPQHFGRQGREGSYDINLKRIKD